MNIELAERVLAHIKAHREAFHMAFGIETTNISYKIDPYPCGTVACIAGWTVLLVESEGKNKQEIARLVQEIENKWEWRDIQADAECYLEIERHESNVLFKPNNLWDKKGAIANFETFIKNKIKEEFKD